MAKLFWSGGRIIPCTLPGLLSSAFWNRLLWELCNSSSARLDFYSRSLMSLLHTYFIYYLVSNNFLYYSGGLHTHMGDTMRHLTVHYYFGNFWEIYSIQIRLLKPIFLSYFLICKVFTKLKRLVARIFIKITHIYSFLFVKFHLVINIFFVAQAGANIHHLRNPPKRANLIIPGLYFALQNGPVNA